MSELSNSDNCFHLANAWLDQCVGKNRDPNCIRGCHESDDACTSPTNSAVDGDVQRESFFPTRTIDVGPADGSCEPYLKENMKEQNSSLPAAWVTLSHCWSGSSPLKTTLAVLEERKTSMPLDQMPQTFRDAITITRKMGIRHLWIDSLCIIQDSAEDWKREASQMGKIYKYGILNIAANTSSGCHAGIFTRRENWSTPVSLPLHSTKQNISGQMYVRLGRWDNYRPGIMGADSTLSSRGWVLQESVLSPRTLHYSRQQIFWECEHLTLAEASIIPVVEKGPSAWISKHQWVSNKMVLPSEITEPSRPSDLDRRADVHFAWRKIVENYTSRKLTFPSDVFAALGGIATAFRVQLGDRYLAGLFEGDFLVSLLWRSVDPDLAQRRLSPSAPSWSWASTIGPVKHEIALNSNGVAPQIMGNCTARIVEANTSSNDESTDLTAVKSGYIVIEGQLLQQGDDLRNLCYIRDDAQKFPENSKTIPNFEAYRYGKFLLDTKETLIGDSKKRLAILHIGIWEWWFRGLPGAGTSWFHRRFAGLLLRATDDTGMKYERVGVVTKEVQYVNVTVDSMFQPEDEHFLQTGWERKTVTIV